MAYPFYNRHTGTDDTPTNCLLPLTNVVIIHYSHSLWISVPGFLWCAVNSFLTGVAAMLVVFLAPVASGSGIPQIKCYLNGLNIPRVMRCLTMIVKGVGVILAVSGGLAVGKEGPMIHIGSVIAAGLSQGRLRFFKFSLGCLKIFRNDQEKRDFVSAGAAAGVAAAFGAPVGGLLFSLEEGASFVYQRLTWTILFASMVSMFTLALFKSLTRTHVFKFTPGGLVSFGTFDSLNDYNAYEILMFLLMGLIGGLSGALFVKANSVLTRYRQKNITTKYNKIIEAILVSSLTTTLCFSIMWAVRDCSPLAYTSSSFPLKMMCADNEFNSISSLLFSTPERSLRTLLHDPPMTYSISVLTIFVLVYYFLACITYGLSVPAGLFIPSLLIGAGWGRIIGNLMHTVDPIHFSDPGKFALIGAAAQLGGIVRMTLSLTVILMEATGNVIVGLPLLMTLTVAKYMGDCLSEGIYDEHIGLNSMALLPWTPHSLSVTKRAYDLMSNPVVYLYPIMRVSELVERIANNLHHGFPVVVGSTDSSRFSYGTLVGMISSEHLALLLQKRVFLSKDGNMVYSLTYKDYDDAYPSYPKLGDVLANLSCDDMDAYLDLRPYMCEAPYSVPETMTMTRVYHLFRLLGLRHLPVVDSQNQVRGIITRKDLRRFKFEFVSGEYRVEELIFSRKM
ncbi:putative chloride channel protein [Schistosoma mansoni]|uniref:putative chloride channel protein n=1 Tax=Schistosoma mansoni TaxID=6183 RepID=UPI0001A63AFA|nr:putative chloride channel protein [Schistosoma mansoni]|eukprot:XP_018654804.1 putative chloride channel protein [Schistosoma mansoni]